MLANKLSLNVTKPEYNILCKRNILCFFCTSFRISNLGVTILITLGDIQINRVKQTKHFWVYPEENLKWAQHIDKVGSNVSRSIRSLRQAWDFVSQDVLTTIYSSLIQPVFDYCDAVWGNLTRDQALFIISIFFASLAWEGKK